MGFLGPLVYWFSWATENEAKAAILNLFILIDQPEAYIQFCLETSSIGPFLNVIGHFDLLHQPSGVCVLARYI